MMEFPGEPIRFKENNYNKKEKEIKMPRVHTQKARKDYPKEGIKKGDMYYKWSIKTGPASGINYRSLTLPKPSQLTGSSFMQEYYSIQE